MTRQLPYLQHMKRNQVLEKYFPPDLDAPMSLWPEPRVRAYQTDALAYILRFAYENNAYYRSAFERDGVTPEDFRQLRDLAKFPFLRKAELIGDPWRLLAVPRSRICQVHSSTGTTARKLGDHAYRLLSWEDIYVSELVTRTHCSPVSPSKPGDVVAMALPYEMSSAGMAMHKTFQYAAQAAVVNVGKGGFYSHPLKTVYAMADLQANIVVTTPSYAVTLAEAARDAGLDIAGAVRAKLLWLTGEPCSDAFRERLSRLWGCEALRYYGSLECGGVGAECVYHAGFHISEEHVFVEIVDARTGRPLPPGMVGEVVMTVLNKTGAPMIRYRTGDLGLLDDDPCKCCLGSPRIFLRGREESLIRLASGVTCLPVQLEQALFSLPEIGNAYQLVVRDGRLTVRAEVARGIVPTPVLAEKVRCRMACFAGEVEAVELVERIATTGGKAQRVVNL